MNLSVLYRFVNNTTKKSNIMYKVIKAFVNVFYPFLHKNTQLGVDSSSNVIISLTSFPARIKTVYLTVSTLLNQTVKPQKVILWLAKDQFPAGEKCLPRKLLELKKYGLTIFFCENLYPHKKYYYCMKKYPENIIITVDDDIFYPEFLVEQLMKVHKDYPKAICCSLAHRITFNENGKIDKYENWEFRSRDEKPSFMLIPIGCGGVLYPPKSLDGKLFDLKTITETCLYTDDLWLKFMALKNRTKVIALPKWKFPFFSIISTQSSGLFNINVRKRKNDISIELLSKLFPECVEVLKETIDN